MSQQWHVTWCDNVVKQNPNNASKHPSLLTIQRTSSRNRQIKRRTVRWRDGNCRDGVRRGLWHLVDPRTRRQKSVAQIWLRQSSAKWRNEVALSSRSGMYRGAWPTRNGHHVGEASTDRHTTRRRKWRKPLTKTGTQIVASLCSMVGTDGRLEPAW